MPVMTNEEFRQEYLRIIAKIALKAAQNNDVNLSNEGVSLNENIYEEEKEELHALSQKATEDDLGEDIEGYSFDLGADLISNEKNQGIFQFFAQDIFDVARSDAHESGESRLNELEIPQNIQNEIKAMAYVAAFEALKESGTDTEKFQHYYQVLNEMSEGVKVLDIEQGEAKEQLDRANGVFENFLKYQTSDNVDSVGLSRSSVERISLQEKFNKAEEAYDLQQELKQDLAAYLAESNIDIFGRSGNLIEGVNLPNFIRMQGEIDNELNGFLSQEFQAVRGQEGEVKVKDFLGALGVKSESSVAQFREQVQSEKEKHASEIMRRDKEHRMNKSQSDNAKEQLAIKILKVSGVSDGRIGRIMQNPNAKAAIIKRSEQAFENAGVNVEQMNATGVEYALKDIDDQALKAEVTKQSKELIAQIGRADSKSLDGQDMRDKEHLHEKYQDKTDKMEAAQFDKNAEKALEYEKSKDGRGIASTIAYNVSRVPAKILNKILPDDNKPLFKPWHKVTIGVVAFAITGGSIVGVAIAAYMIGSAAKEKFYNGSKLQEWVKEKFYNKLPEKFNSQELEQVTAQGLVEDVKNQYPTREQEHGRGRGERSVEMGVVASQDRGLEEARAIAATMQDQGVGSNLAALGEVRAASHVAALQRGDSARTTARGGR